MDGVKFQNIGHWDRSRNFLKSALNLDFLKDLDYYAKEGVSALRSNTPVDTGLTASSWDYEILNEDGKVTIYWTNSNVQGIECNVAVILQYGHVSRNGGWVEGIDYINPALRSVFEQIANNAWLRLTKL